MWPYETDVRIPFYIRGPGIAPGTVRTEMAMNIDIAPTLLDAAGITVPPTCDGKSLYVACSCWPPIPAFFLPSPPRLAKGLPCGPIHTWSRPDPRDARCMEGYRW